GYGHGAVAAARAFVEAGAAALGVSTVEEGAELRRAGVRGPIVVLGGAFPGEEGAVVADDLEGAVWEPATGEALGGPGRPARRAGPAWAGTRRTWAPAAPPSARSRGSGWRASSPTSRRPMRSTRPRPARRSSAFASPSRRSPPPAYAPPRFISPTAPPHSPPR